jgi:alpha-D-ribose 1-methylphosphonate 5-triphosphate diphosphatase
MKGEVIYSKARLVLRDQVLPGTLRVVDGRIAEYDTAGTDLDTAIDCEGDYLIPGLVELHTDNLERHFTPRPKVHWHPGAAVMAHDAQMATAGITTVFDAVFVGDEQPNGSRRRDNLRVMLDALRETQGRDYLRADHRVHLRCEVTWHSAVETFAELADDPLLGIVSVMDHSPGQRQFLNEDSYRTYYMGKFGMTPAQMDEFAAKQRQDSARYAGPNRVAITEGCRQRDLILASHDDATPAHIAEARELGVHFSEFPTTLEAAEAARAVGMKVLMGAPNLVRGGSHSGNISAAKLAAAGCLDILSSDYVPVSLLHGAFLLHREPLGLPLPEAIATVTAAPAEVAGFDDRGIIEAGRSADLVRVHDTGDVPVIRAVWRAGRQVG